MAELVRGQPALQMDFLPSLGLDVLSTMGLVCLVHDFEGLDEWLVETAAALPPRLRHDLQLCMRIGQYPYILVEALAEKLLQPATAPAHHDFAAFYAAINGLSAAECRTILITVLDRAAERSEISLAAPMADLINDQERLEQFINQLELPMPTAEVVDLVQHPTEWRALLASTTQRFWDRAYRDAYMQQQSLRERNVQYQRSHGYSANFADTFVAVTGRLLPDYLPDRMTQRGTQQVRFVPSQYIGPYLSFLFTNNLLTVVYNSRVTPIDGDQQAERVQSLYQPLAALADKTRLHIMSLLRGRELYAQEIVNLLEIHQSAVSRHLKLMEAAGVLLVRRDKGAKYYSINRQRIEEISQQLLELMQQM